MKLGEQETEGKLPDDPRDVFLPASPAVEATRKHVFG